VTLFFVWVGAKRGFTVFVPRLKMCDPGMGTGLELARQAKEKNLQTTYPERTSAV
jgi:hypothetical protein